MTTQMNRYMEMLQKLMPTPNKVRLNNEAIDIKLKPNQIYAVICNDNENYYRTVSIRKNDFIMVIR